MAKTYITGSTIAIISGMSLTLYAIPYDDIADRLSNTFTLLLTLVAFEFVVSITIPVVPYTTIMDEYLLVSFVFIGAICVQNVYFYIDTSLKGHNLEAVLMGGCIYVSYNIFFAFYSIYSRIQENKKIYLSHNESMNTSDRKMTVFFVESTKTRHNFN